MKRCAYLLSVLLLMGCGEAIPEKQVTTTIEDGVALAYVDFPMSYGAVNTSSRELPTPADIGTLTYTMYTAELEPNTCALGYVDYPPRLFKNKTPTQLMDMARAGRVEKGQVLESETYWNLGAFPARTCTFSYVNNGKKIYERHDMIVAYHRVYDLNYLGIGSDGRNAPEVKAFFDSLKITLKH